MKQMTAQADKGNRGLNFQVGNWILLKVQPYRQISTAKRTHNKLSKRCFRPFQILESIGKVAYKLDLRQQSKFHLVFHISLLKPYDRGTPLILASLAPLSTDNNPTLNLEAILDQRTILINNTSKSSPHTLGLLTT